MKSDTYRNHPVVLLKNILLVLFIMLFMFISVFGSAVGMGIMAVITVLLCLLMALFWKRTTITFGPSEAVVESNVFYKKRKTIPYKKISAVNVVRDIFNRISGTTTLNININSSSNASVPEASFTFKADLAEQLKTALTANLFEETESENDLPYDSLIELTMKDSVLHGFVGTSTYQFLFAIAMVFYSIFSAIFLEGAGILGAFLLLVIGEIIPVIFTILKYGNFKVYRINDQIHLQHGILQNYTSKFDVNRINAVRIKKTFFARLMNKSSLEAEVVGINAVSDETHPLLCILADNNKIEALIEHLVPEFIHDPPMEKQPRKALHPLLIKSTAGALIIAAIMAYPCYWVYTGGYESLGEMLNVGSPLLKYVPIVATVIAALLPFYGAHVSYRVREFGLGDDLFNLVNGLLDREIVIMQYDRVQIVQVYGSIFITKLGLSRCVVKLLSSEGYRNIRSGYFEKKELEKIGDIMMHRLRDGEYRYDKFSI